MPDFRRGTAAIAEAQEASKKGGNFSPFAPSIGLKDGDEKYLLFLNPIEDIPLVNIHEWVPLEEVETDKGSYTKFGFYISRKDPAIGEDYDEIEDRLGTKPKLRNIAVAVELEPIIKTVKGRSRPTGFEVKTTEFERRVDPDDEESGKETVTAPVIGLVSQSPNNFFGYLSSYNENEGDINETPFKVTRQGNDKNTQYHFVPYINQNVDLDGLVDNVDGITYLNEEMDELVEAIEGAESIEEAATIIGGALLEARLDELCDKEKYDTEIADVEEIPGYGKKGKAKGSSKKKSERKSRTSQRTRKTRTEEEPDADDSDDAPEETEEPKSSSARKSRFNELKAQAKKKKATA